MRLDVIRHCGTAGLGLGLMALTGAHGALAQSVSAPDIVPRSSWSAKPADRAQMKRQTPHEIVIHHTSERQQPKLTLGQKLRKLESFSRVPGIVDRQPKPAWGDVPYHFYVDAAGRIGEGRAVSYAGDTNTAYSTIDRIQIALEGQFDQERPTRAQLRSLDRLVVWLANTYRIPAGKVSGHNDHAVTACPGQNLTAYVPELRDKVAKAASAGR
jgi:N-acetyl-anhydromuramyl-L-alanine amidase AmpD